VLIIERADELGGTSALSGGRIWIPGNHCPENSADTPEAARAYLDGLFNPLYPHMTDAFLDAAPAMARFVEAHTPHRFAACAHYPDYHPERPGATLGGRCLDMRPADLNTMTPLARLVRTPPGYLPMTHAEWEQWRYPSRFDWKLLEARERDGIRTNGVALVAALLDGAVRAGASVVTGARLVDVELGPDGAVASAVVALNGATIRVSAGAVILATGGYDWDTDLRASQQPGPQRATGAPPTNTGDGLRIAQRLGAAVDNLTEGWWMPMMAIPGEMLDGQPYYRSLIRERAAPRQIMVNAAGLRFADEASPYNDVGKAMHQRTPDIDGVGAYPNDPAYMIFDEGFKHTYPLPGTTPGQDAPPWIARADSLRELAAKVGVDPDGLEATVENWNKASAAGSDQDFGRGANPYDRYGGDPDAHPNPNLGPITNPPYYGVRVLAGTIGTKGGPVTDAEGTVLTEGGTPISGLYAVGNTSAFWTADAYPAPGATLAIGMTMAYRAARHAARR
jgi:succinate dehydrogenase/fumarate reductase flavoprotein subunit